MAIVASTILWTSLLLPAGNVGISRLDPAEFVAWFEDARAGTLQVPDMVRHRAEAFRYVFVVGFQNERMPGYFTQNAHELRAQGVPRSAIHVLRPSSHQTIDASREVVIDALHDFAAEGPERLVVIAHSRGACDVLAFALAEPDFVREHVEALFLVQGPFGGTPVADYVTGSGTPMDRRMPMRHRLVAFLLSRVERFLLKRGRHGALADLTRDASAQFWTQEVRDHADAIPIVAARTVFVTTHSPPTGLRLLRRTTAWYLSTYYGANDGLVILDDQCLPGLGTCVEIPDLGHTDLTHRFPASFAGRRTRRALVQSILMTVGQPETILTRHDARGD